MKKHIVIVVCLVLALLALRITFMYSFARGYANGYRDGVCYVFQTAGKPLVGCSYIQPYKAK